MSTKVTSASTIFHAFRRLPVELRFKIWEESLKANSSRVVEINFSFKTMRWHPCAPPPAQLHVSQEARQFALRLYQAAPLQRNGPRPIMVFLDFSRDILFLHSQTSPRPGFFGQVYNQVLLNLDSIRDNCVHIAFPSHLVTGMPFVRLLAHFKRLEALTIVAPMDTTRKSSNHDEELSFVPDRRTRKKMSGMLAAAEIIRFSTVVKVVHHAQAVRGEEKDETPNTVDGEKRSKRHRKSLT